MQEVYRRASNINWSPQESETLILNIENKNEIVELNSSAAMIWKWTNGSNSIKDISRKLSQFYKIPFENAYEDVIEIFEMWHEDELVFLDSNKTIV